MDYRNYNLYLEGKFSPFKRKAYILTRSEQELFSLIRSAIADLDCLVFPQQHLSTFLQVKDDADDLTGKFGWLNTLFVDFVIFDKEAVQPILVIELNDKTHFWNSRKGRDQFVAKALKENNIPLLIISTDDLYNGNASKLLKENLL